MRRKRKSRYFGKIMCSILISMLILTSAGIAGVKVLAEALSPSVSTAGQVADIDPSPDIDVTGTDPTDPADPADSTDPADPSDPSIPSEPTTPDETPSKMKISDGYCYQTLAEEEQTIYEEILQGVLTQEETIRLDSTDGDAICNVYELMMHDRPELFWCTGAMQYTSYPDHTEVNPTYSCTGVELTRRQSEIDSAVQDCLSGISSTASEYDKIRYIFEYLVDTVDYDLEAPDNQNIYSSLVNRVSVCAGYARAAQHLLQNLGIECLYVTGDSDGPHAWNIVKCDGKYYQLDVTFGDPVYTEEENGFSAPADSINYDYLCCTDEEMYRNHTPDDTFPLPECTSDDLNYFRLNGMYYDTYDRNVMLENMNQSIYDKEDSFTCKFAGRDLYQQAHDDIINNLLPQAVQNLADHYGLANVNYSYTEDDVMARITIYWNYQ